VKLYSVKQCGGEPLATLWKVNMPNFSEDIQTAERYSGLENDVKNEEQEEKPQHIKGLDVFLEKEADRSCRYTRCLLTKIEGELSWMKRLSRTVRMWVIYLRQ
jgi:hypothetical protein